LGLGSFMKFLFLGFGRAIPRVAIDVIIQASVA